MQKLKIFTNNPDVAYMYPEVTCYQDGDVNSVFIAVRDATHLCATLISHPLSGSIKPNENPYKSVVLFDNAANILDFKSISIIEDAIAVLKKMPVKQHDFSEAVLEDFRVIDLELVDSAMATIGDGKKYRKR